MANEQEEIMNAISKQINANFKMFNFFPLKY